MKITLKRAGGTLTALLAVGLLATGCQQDPAAQQTTQPSGDGSTQPSTSQSAELPSTAWTRASADEVADGGTLTLSVGQMPSNWNPSHADGALADLTDMRQPQGQDQYLLADEGGTVSINPDYLVSAELKSEDPQVVEVKFNPDAKWEDGTPITIADLAAYQQALSGTNEAFEVASTAGWADIESVTQTTDEFTGEITFSKLTADWIIYTYPTLPASISSDPTAFNTGYVTTPVPSQGPFKIANIDQTGGVVTLERNPVWWGDTPKLETIIFRVVTQANEPQAFANGELDALSRISTADTFTTAKGRADANVQTTNGVTWTHVTLNTTRGALADPEVRKAIALGINREVIGQAVVGPLEAPVVLVNNGVFMPGQAGYEDSYGGEISYDPERAEQVLTDAGYEKDGDGIYAKDGEKLEFSVIVPAETQSNADRAAQIQKDLNAIGFNVSVETVPSDQYFSAYVIPKNFDMVTFSWQGTLFPIQSSANLWYPVDSQQNFTGYSNPDVGPLNEAAQAEFDPQARIDKANEMSAAMLNDYTIIPFYATPNIVAVRNDVVNYGASQFESIDWTIVGFKA